MDLIPSSGTFCFNYTAFDQDETLSVQASIYDVSSGSPVFLTTVNLVGIAHGAYTGNYTGALNKTYLVAIAVFTDNTYATVNTERPPVAYCFQTLISNILVWAVNYAAYDLSTGLSVRASVYDVATGSPVFVQNVILTHVTFGIYFGVFTGTLGQNYNIETLVYVDGTFTTLNLDYSPGVDNFSPLVFTPFVNVNNFIAATLVGLSTEANLKGQNLNAVLIGDN